MAEIKEKNQVRPMTEDEKSAKEQQMQAPADFEPEQLSFAHRPLPGIAASGGTRGRSSTTSSRKQTGTKQKVNEDGEILDDDGEVLNLRFRKKLKIVIMNCLQRNTRFDPFNGSKQRVQKIEQNIGV